MPGNSEAAGPHSDRALFWVQAVAKQPIITTFRVEADFMYYAGGVYSGTSCTSNEINHGLLIVGYR